MGMGFLTWGWGNNIYESPKWSSSLLDFYSFDLDLDSMILILKLVLDICTQMKFLAVAV